MATEFDRVMADGSVLRYAMRGFWHFREADDLTQEALMGAWLAYAARDAFDPEGKLDLAFLLKRKARWAVFDAIKTARWKLVGPVGQTARRTGYYDRHHVVPIDTVEREDDPFHPVDARAHRATEIADARMTVEEMLEHYRGERRDLIDKLLAGEFNWKTDTVVYHHLRLLRRHHREAVMEQRELRAAAPAAVQRVAEAAEQRRAAESVTPQSALDPRALIRTSQDVRPLHDVMLDYVARAAEVAKTHTQAAEKLGIGRATLYRYLQQVKQRTKERTDATNPDRPAAARHDGELRRGA